MSFWKSEDKAPKVEDSEQTCMKQYGRYNAADLKSQIMSDVIYHSTISSIPVTDDNEAALRITNLQVQASPNIYVDSITENISMSAYMKSCGTVEPDYKAMWLKLKEKLISECDFALEESDMDDYKLGISSARVDMLNLFYRIEEDYV